MGCIRSFILENFNCSSSICIIKRLSFHNKKSFPLIKKVRNDTMLLRWMKEKIKYKQKTESIEDVISDFLVSVDFVHYEQKINGRNFFISYYSTLVDPDRVVKDCIPY